MENSEKVSVNINVGDLALIDFLIEKGFYSNRSDFINQSIRNTLDSKSDLISVINNDNIIKQNPAFIGLYGITTDDLITAKNKNEKINVKGYGVLYVECDDQDLILDVIESINVKGKVKFNQNLNVELLKEKYSLK